MSVVDFEVLRPKLDAVMMFKILVLMLGNLPRRSGPRQITPGDGYLAALIKFRWLASALWSTDETVERLGVSGAVHDGGQRG
ncbi:hypothetical protein [Azospirillum largimobile]